MKFKKIVTIALSAALCLSPAACGSAGQEPAEERGEDTAKTVVLAESWDISEDGTVYTFHPA